jgi:uncharacterized delta-60 repeat protein
LLAFDVPAGIWDNSFDGFGLQITNVASADRVGTSALQPDGKIIVAGSVTESSGSQGSQTIALVRYLKNGQPDTSFGHSGVVVLDPALMIDQVYGAAVDRNPGSPFNGDIVVAGYSTDPAQQHELALVRFQSNGVLDTSFGTAGVVLDTRESNATGLALVIGPDDKIAVLGASNWSSASAVPFLERFNTDGTPDPGFGAGGQPVLPFGNVPAALRGGLALDAGGNIVVAGIENASASSSTIMVARITPAGQPDLSFGTNGLAITVVQPFDSINVPINVQGVAIDPSRGIVVAGTAESFFDGSPSSSGFWATRYDQFGKLDPSFNNGSLQFVSFPPSGPATFSDCSSLALEPDGKVVLAGETPATPDGYGSTQENIALARLNTDGSLDESFGEGGQVVEDNGGGELSSELPSVLVQPDGNIVTAFTYAKQDPRLPYSEFGVERFFGQVGSSGLGTATIAAGIYKEDFVDGGNPTKPTLDNSMVFQHWLWDNSQLSLDRLDVAQGHGWDIKPVSSGGAFGLQEGFIGSSPAAVDAITFPNLRPDVRVGLASVDVSDSAGADVTFVGANGSYTFVVTRSKQTAAAGEAQVLQGDPLDPTLELGPIREIILASPDATFSNIQIVVIPGQGPLDDFVTAAPGTSTAIDVLTHAEAEAPAAGLQLPLQLIGTPGPPSLPGSTTAQSGNQIIYSNTQGAGPGVHPTDAFTYTVQDASNTTATGTVYITIDTPPTISVTPDPPAEVASPGPGWEYKHGTLGPLTGVVILADAEHDPLMLTVDDQLSAGKVTLSHSPGSYQYTYSYAPPTTYAYDPTTGVAQSVSAIVGNDQFTFVASDGLTSTEFTVPFFVVAPGDSPPLVGNLQFAVPENVGVSYYASNHMSPLDVPGLVHFAAPGALWTATDPDGDPLRALADPADPPQNGKLELFPDGSFNYTPRKNFAGMDRFGFFANDGYLSSVDPVNNTVVQPSFVTIYVTKHVSASVNLDLSYAFDGVSAVGFGLPQPIKIPAPANWSITGVRPLPVDEYVADNSVDTMFKYDYILVKSIYANDMIASNVLTAFDVAGVKMSPPGSNYFTTEDFGTGDHTFDLSKIQAPLSVLKGGNLDLSFTYCTVADFGIHGTPPEPYLGNFATVHLVIDGYRDVAPFDTGYGAGALLAPPGTSFSGASASPVPADASAPSDLIVPWIISFGLNLLDGQPHDTPATAVEVTIILPARAPHFTTYYKAEINPLNLTYHWYPFMYDPAHGHPTGAEILTDPSNGQQTIILHLEDGALGDLDHTVNGSIWDPAAPSAFTNPAQNFVASVYEDVLGRGPSTAEMASWVKKLEQGESRLKVAQTIWSSTEHRLLQIQAWSTQFLGHPATAAEQAQWLNLLRRGKGEIAVEQSILTSPEYLRAHPTPASFAAGLAHDVLHEAGSPINPAQGHGGQISRGSLAHQVLISSTAAAILAQEDAIAFLGRPATTQQKLADLSALRSSSRAPEQLAEQILASDAFYQFVNSALPANSVAAHAERHVHKTTGRGR